MKKKYYLVTIKNIFNEMVKRDVIAEEINGELYDILLGSKIYAIDSKEIGYNFYFDTEKFIKEKYDFVGIVFSEVSRIYVLNYFKDMKKDILNTMMEIKEDTYNSLKDKGSLVFVSLYDKKIKKY